MRRNTSRDNFWRGDVFNGSDPNDCQAAPDCDTRRLWEKLPHDFPLWAKWSAPRYRAVFEAILRISSGRPRFSCKVSDIAEEAGYATNRIVQLALKELQRDGWVEVKRHRPPGSSLSYRNRYTLPHLLSPLDG